MNGKKGKKGKMTLEVFVDSYRSLKTAVAAGADRIELCSALNLGGLTPSFGLMQQAISFREERSAQGYKNLEVVAMIRPRSGDFCYTADELETMAVEIGQAKAMGFDGVVMGILLPNGNLDLMRLEALVALEGAAYIKDLQLAYGHLITIMPGAGVHMGTIQDLIDITGCTHYHMSGKINLASEMTYFPDWQPSTIKTSERTKQEASFDEIKWVHDHMFIATLSD